MGNPLRVLSKAAVVLVVAWGGVPAVALATDHPVSFPSGALPSQYSPSSVEAGIGDTVTFSGAFGSHPLVWGTNDFATQSSGTTQTFTFTHAGTFTFHCQIHPSVMFGSVHIGGNAFATPDFSWTPTSPKTGQAVTFTPGAFVDPDGSVVSYQWDLNGDGSYETTGASPTRTYTTAGSVNVGLRYVDNSHETSPATTHLLTVAQGSTTGGGGGGGGGGGTGGGGGSPSPSPSPTPSTPGGSSSAPGGTGGTTTSPGGGEQGAGTSTGTTALRVRLGARALTFRSGHAHATVILNLAGTARATLRLGKTVLATGGATLRAGTRSVRLTLTKAGTRTLRARAHRSARATLTVVVRRRTGAKATTVKRTLTVKLA